jgi:predicted RecB family nuclease
MKITTSLVEAYLKCPFKCFLLSAGEKGTANSYDQWMRTENESYRKERTEHMVSEMKADEWVTSVQEIKNIKSVRWRLALDATIDQKNLESNIHAVRQVPNGHDKIPRFVPVRFLFANKITRNDKLLVAFDALVLCEHLRLPVTHGELIYGESHTRVRVKTAELLKEVRKIASGIDRLISGRTPPSSVLNRHCAECEYQAHCSAEAAEKDDLSLLSGLSAKERKDLNSRGIFTVNHLSHAFKPRRRSKRSQDKPEKYHHSLKALAIREQKIHVVGSDQLKIGGTPVYLDVEAIPDRNFYYLIGVRTNSDNAPVQCSLWADDQGDQERIWRDFIGIVSAIHDPILVHYGSFETTFLKSMCDRYGSPGEESRAEKAIRTAVNLLSFIYARIYFPTHSNGLKDVGRYVGFKWSEENPSGVKTMLWRGAWEKSREPSLKQKLITYNAEDCEALQRTTEFVRTISGPGDRDTADQHHIIQADSLPRNSWCKWGKPQYLLPALGEIGRTARWDYQQEKINLRSGKRFRKVMRPTNRSRGSTPRPNKVIQWPKPDACIRCGQPNLYSNHKYTKEVIDVKFGRAGLKRWITKYVSYYYRCPVCHAVFHNQDRPWDGKKYGRNLLLLCAYLNIDLRMSQKRIAAFLREVFGFQVSSNVVNKFKEKVAVLYRPTYERLLNNVVSGKLIHVDETPVNLEGKTGYVWAFATMEDMAYVYAPSREGALAQTFLKNFKGVLVTDFYSAYDSINCPQQKCLLHLVRDLNDGLLKEPFNEELKELVASFANLLKPMVETVDRFGLKVRFLRKHKKHVERFFKDLSRHQHHTEAAIRITTRFEKNRSTLFTFLDYDGVPWNNNNAEHAIKAVTLLRRNLGGLSTERAISDYLILLSVCETCKFKGVGFLDFLRSGEEDIDVYVTSQNRRRNEKQRIPSKGPRR